MSQCYDRYELGVMLLLDNDTVATSGKSIVSINVVNEWVKKQFKRLRVICHDRLMM
jgi:hypothetical protein